MRQTLAAWGCTAVVAPNVGDAIAQGLEHPAQDAMLVDFRLPSGHAGIATIAQLRESFGRAVPALIVSGESSAEELARIEQSGFVLLHKPVAPARLRAALSYLLSQADRAAA